MLKSLFFIVWHRIKADAAGIKGCHRHQRSGIRNLSLVPKFRYQTGSPYSGTGLCCWMQVDADAQKSER